MIKKGDYVAVNIDSIGVHTFYTMGKVVRINKNKQTVFVDFGEERVYRYRISQVERVG